MQNKNAFTLIELLVVVLIIGILAAIALPQYTKAIEKSRATEVIINTGKIMHSLERHRLQNGWGNEFCNPETALDITLAGGLWSDFEKDYATFTTKHFTYYVYCGENFNGVDTYKNAGHGEPWTLTIGESMNADASLNKWKHCYASLSKTGEMICRTLEAQGFKYFNGEY